MTGTRPGRGRGRAGPCELGALTVDGVDRDADLVFVATPVRAAAGVIGEILSSGRRRPDVVVTDVGA